MTEVELDYCYCFLSACRIFDGNVYRFVDIFFPYTNVEVEIYDEVRFMARAREVFSAKLCNHSVLFVLTIRVFLKDVISRFIYLRSYCWIV